MPARPGEFHSLIDGVQTLVQCPALERNGKEYAQIEREQNGQTQGKFPGILWEQHPPKGAMSPDAFWHEISLPMFESQYQKEGEKVTDLLDDEKWGALEYCEHELMSVPLHWCHHFGKIPRAKTKEEMDLAIGQANNPKDNGGFL